MGTGLGKHIGVLVTRSNHERVVAVRVENLGFPVYRPVVRFPKKDGRYRVESLFDRYVFFGHRGGTSWVRAKSARGVLDVIMDGENPCPVPKSEIERMRSREDSEGFYVIGAFASRFSRGQVVIPQRGAFAGVRGVYDGPTPQHRARVLYEILGARSAATIDEDDLELSQ